MGSPGKASGLRVADDEYLCHHPRQHTSINHNRPPAKGWGDDDEQSEGEWGPQRGREGAESEEWDAVILKGCEQVTTPFAPQWQRRNSGTLAIT